MTNNPQPVGKLQETYVKENMPQKTQEEILNLSAEKVRELLKGCRQRPIQHYISKLNQMIISAEYSGRNYISMSDLKRVYKYIPTSKTVIENICQHYIKNKYNVQIFNWKTLDIIIMW